MRPARLTSDTVAAAAVAAVAVLLAETEDGREVCGSLLSLAAVVVAAVRRLTEVRGSAAAANAADAIAPALLPRKPHHPACSYQCRPQKTPNRAAGAAILVVPATAATVVSRMLLSVGYSLQNKTEIAGCEGWPLSEGFATAPATGTSVTAAAAAVVLGYSELAPTHLAPTLAAASAAAASYDERARRLVGEPLQTTRVAHSQTRQ